MQSNYAQRYLVTSFDYVASVFAYTGQTGALSSAAGWTTASSALFIPVIIRFPMSFDTFYYPNTGTNSGNIDLGLYDPAGNLISSKGGAAMSGASTAVSKLTVTAFSVTPGYYYLAMVIDNTTGRIPCDNATQVAHTTIIGVKEMATAYPLPNPATFAAVTTFTRIPFFGMAPVGITL